MPATPSSPSDEEDDMLKVIFFRGPDGQVHPYVVSGVMGKHLSPQALEIHKRLGTVIISSPSEGFDKPWQDGVALLDGPLRNGVGTRRGAPQAEPDFGSCRATRRASTCSRDMNAG
jgi:hypothetical protein